MVAMTTKTTMLGVLLAYAHLSVIAATSGRVETVAAAPDTRRAFLHQDADERSEHYHPHPNYDHTFHSYLHHPAPEARSDQSRDDDQEEVVSPDNHQDHQVKQTQKKETFDKGFPEGFTAGLEKVKFNAPPSEDSQGFFEPPPENLAAAMSSYFDDTKHPLSSSHSDHTHHLHGSGSGSGSGSSPYAGSFQSPLSGSHERSQSESHNNNDDHDDPQVSRHVESRDHNSGWEWGEDGEERGDDDSPQQRIQARSQLSPMPAGMVHRLLQYRRPHPTHKEEDDGFETDY